MAKAKKTVKKSAKKVVKKSFKKATKKKAVVKKVSVKKTAKKAVKKPTAKKVSKKIVKKTAKKAVIKSTAIKTQKPNYNQVVTPLGERVLVRLIQAEAVTAGGIIIPGTVATQMGYMKAEVLAVGAGAKNKKGMLKPLDVKAGDTILFQRHVAVKIEYNGEELFILNESNILGTV